jgi:di/tricarboxylate transporter
MAAMIAMVFGTGYVPQAQMMRVGLVLNICMSLLMASGAWLLLSQDDSWPEFQAIRG